MAAETEKNECIDVVIPQDAVQIRVTNIINPYFIRIYEIPDDRNRKNNLCRTLYKVQKHQMKKGSTELHTCNVGDDVIVSNNYINSDKIDLPDWICRGIVTDTTLKTTDVFLLDYGIIVNVPTESLIKYSSSSVRIPALTFTVGIYNILPVDLSFRLVKHWPKKTIDFMKELIQTSKEIYFQVLAYDRKTAKIYGDLFLVIENKNICLSKVLIHSLLAVPLYLELLLAIKSNTNADDIWVPYQLGKTFKDDKSTHSSTNSDCFLSQKRSINFKRKQTNEKILIRSKFKCHPLEHLADSRFTTLIHKALKHQGVYALKHIQTYMWPAIKQCLNVVNVSPPSSGKTIGYIVPVANCIAANEEAILEAQKNCITTKPVALVLCASINKVIDITTTFNDILYYHSSIKSQHAFNGLTDKHLLTSICNKFHILVSTPPFLLRLLSKYSNKLKLSELSFLVIDQADILLNKYLTEFISLIKNYKIINKDNKNTIQGGSMQIIAVSDTWTDKIDSFLHMFVEDPYICIGSFTEAAAFCRVQARMLIRHTSKKKYDVESSLGDYSIIRTMIFCLNAKEAIELNNFLESYSVKTLIAHEDMPITKIHEVRDDWAKYLSGMYPVIICTDEILSELEISDVEFLIHYSITNTSKTQFNRRFSVLMDNWILDLKNKCRVLILFDETKENAHFKGVLSILNRLNVELPHDWNKIADGLELASNLKKKDYPICDYIKSFGICEINTCPYRHRVIAEVDTPSTSITIGDELKLHVTFIHSASHFAARVMECIRICDKTGAKETFTFPYDIIKLEMKMRKYYLEAKNRRTLKDITISKFCGLRSADNKFSRVQIIGIIDSDIKTNKPKNVIVRCIDDGQIFQKVSVYELYELSEELLKDRFAVIDIFLTGISPFDGENKWTHIARNQALSWFKENSTTSTSYVTAKVLLHIGHSIWTDSLAIRSKLIGYKDLLSSSLKDVLKKHEHGTENKQHLHNLLHMCHSGGLTHINDKPIPLPDENEAKNDLYECD